MINEKLTVEKFNYSTTLLNSSSHKRVIVICDYCNNDYECTYKNRNNSFKKFPKDSCSNCKFKKREDVSLSLHGVKNSSQRKEVREKISIKNSEMLKSKEFKNASKNKMLEKYGVEHAMQNLVIKEKGKKTLLSKYGVENVMHLPEVAKKAGEKSFNTKVASGIITLYDGKTAKEHAVEKGYSKSHFGKLIKKIGFEEALKSEKTISSLDKAVMSFLDQQNIKYITQLRVENIIADIIVGDLIIECDGNYWHSDLYLEQDYHVRKKEIYNKNGYTSLFFRSHEIQDKFSIVSSIILNKLGITKNRLYARDCVIKDIEPAVAKEFYTKNHLMGSGRGAAIGLFYNDNLVMAGQFCRLKNNSWDLSRMCAILNTSVIGGYSKILKYFEKKYTPESLQNFIDLRYGSGEYLGNLGFIKSTCYPSFKWTDGNRCFNRMRFPGNSGYNNGLFKIWDCGQQKWLKKY